MGAVDALGGSLLDDERLIELVFQAQGRRWNKSRARGRWQTPSEVVLRLLLLKHIRLELPDVGAGSARQSDVSDLRPHWRRESSDAKTMGRLGQAIGGEVVVQLHRRVVELAVEKKVVQGRKMLDHGHGSWFLLVIG